MLLIKNYFIEENWFWYMPEETLEVHIWNVRYLDMMEDLNIDRLSLEAYFIRINTFSYSTNQV